VLVKNISDDLLCYSLGRCEKKVIDNSFSAVAHGQGVRDEFESGDFLQAITKCRGNGIVWVFDFVRRVQFRNWVLLRAKSYPL
jgi:hypothetical protein